MTKPKTPREVCKRGHVLTSATILVQRNGRERCMVCLTESVQKAARTAKLHRYQCGRPLVRAKPRPRKPWLTPFTHNPVLFAECKALYDAALAREEALHTREAIGRAGALAKHLAKQQKARQGKTADQVRPAMVYGRGL